MDVEELNVAADHVEALLAEVDADPTQRFPLASEIHSTLIEGRDTIEALGAVDMEMEGLRPVAVRWREITERTLAEVFHVDPATLNTGEEQHGV